MFLASMPGKPAPAQMLGPAEPGPTESRPPKSPEEMQAQQASIFLWKLRFAAGEEGSHPPKGALMALSRPDVANDLSLSGPQKEVVRQLAKALQARFRRTLARDIETIPSLPPARWEEAVAASARERSQIVAQAEALVRQEVLSRPQADRLKQIEWRWRGVRALVEDPEVADRLGLTRTQRLTIAQRSEEAKSVRYNPPPDLFAMLVRPNPNHEQSEAARRLIAAINRLAEQRIWEVLTPQQSRRWAELIGEPLNPPGSRASRQPAAQGQQRGAEDEQDGVEGRHAEVGIPAADFSPVFRLLLAEEPIADLELSEEERAEIVRIARAMGLTLRLALDRLGNEPSDSDLERAHAQIAPLAERLVAAMLSPAQRDALHRELWRRSRNARIQPVQASCEPVNLSYFRTAQ